MPRENPLRFNPETQKNFRTSRRYFGRAKEWMCGDHREAGWIKGGEYCPRCVAECRPQDGVQIVTGECYRGWYEHLGPKPVWIESKAHLYRECKARGLEARCLMSGGRMRRPRGA